MKRFVPTALAFTLLVTVNTIALPALASSPPSASDTSISCAADTKDAEHVLSNLEYISSLTFLTQKDRDILLTTYNQIDKLGAELDALYDQDGNLIHQTDREKADTIEKAITDTYESISSLESQIIAQTEIDFEEPFNTKAYVDTLDFLTETERNTLLVTYEKIDHILNEISALSDENGNYKAADEAKVTELWNQYEAISKQTAPMEEKITQHNKQLDTAVTENFIASLPFLSQEEKSTLLSAYQEIDKLSSQLDQLYNAAGELSAENEQKANVISVEMDQISHRIAPIEEKIMSAEL